MSDDSAFTSERETAIELLEDDSISAFYLGVIRDSEEIDTTFAQTADSPEDEGLQALSLLATHVRIVANQAGVDPSTVAGDAATLAGRLEDLSPEGMRSTEESEPDES
ncbi:hypothetical protein [Natronocalculus amylovorans]|uniref:DUF8113 domain-containing protein n=1 Tax=Natronocalculus amylovorans TaxID=2917812 RepID=A0AAE3FW46_9EURY|nr:hypothetical protein [Natronocalculus amylovorans]MCL9816413.1 hypothetical protein [Natronocalculus amylovorans]NUE03505.1 hypothetical protein [Halorubraceae archaeon YAN]